MKLNKVEPLVHSLKNYKMKLVFEAVDWGFYFSLKNYKIKLNKVEPPVHSLKNYKMKLNKVEPPVHIKLNLVVFEAVDWGFYFSLQNYKMKLNKVEPSSPQPQKLQDEA